MSTIITRVGKGAPLTNAEVDANFSNLNTDKLELGGTYSSGTANGVAYLNGSKAITTGSALTFDGTTLTSGNLTVTGTVDINGGAIDGTTIGATTASAGDFTVLTENASPAVVQTDIGTAPNEIPLNQYLGNLAYQDAENIAGNVGIGTSSPVARLQTPGQVVGGPSSESAPVTANTLSGFTGLGSFNDSIDAEDIDALYLRKGGTNGSSVGISFASAHGDVYFVGARIKHLRSGTNSDGHLVFETKGDGSANETIERLRITSAGSVGIGTSSPTQLLHLSKSGIAGMRIEDTDTAGGYVDLEVNGSAFFIDSHDEDGTEGLVVFRTAGTETMRIDSAGNVGIGTSSPTQKLRVVGTSGTAQFGAGTAGNAVFINAYDSDTIYMTASTSNANAFGFGSASNIPTFFMTNNTERMRIDSAGNVGIGTSAPLTALNVNGTGGELVRLSVTVNSGAIQEPALGFATGVTNTHPAAKISALEYDPSDSRASLLFYTRGDNGDFAPTERMRIDSAGNVGIGTSSPVASLDIQNSTSVNQLRLQTNKTNSTNKSSAIITGHYTNSEEGLLTVGGFSTATENSVYIGGGYGTANAATTVLFYTAANNTTTGGSERMRITSGGELLVGTTSSPGVGVMRVAAVSSSAIMQLERTTTSAGSGYIGATSTNAFTVYNQSLSQVFYVTQSGACYNLTGTYGSFSDIKIKENVSDARGYLNDLCRVRIVKYSLKSEAKQEADKLGVIAQELEQIFPGMIEQSVDLKDGVGEPTGETTKTVKYSVFVPMLIKAMQEQQAIIESLKARLDAANL